MFLDTHQLRSRVSVLSFLSVRTSARRHRGFFLFCFVFPLFSLSFLCVWPELGPPCVFHSFNLVVVTDESF